VKSWQHSSPCRVPRRSDLCSAKTVSSAKMAIFVKLCGFFWREFSGSRYDGPSARIYLIEGICGSAILVRSFGIATVGGRSTARPSLA
jgi:hypothetical protein